MNEFERALASAVPAEPEGNPMQIMYLAGRQSASLSLKPQSENRVWKFTSLVSSAVAAGLLIFVVISQPKQSPLAQSSAIDTASSSGDIAAREIGADPRSQIPARSRSSLRPTPMSYDPMEIAQAPRPQNSINMFDNFELRDMEIHEWRKEIQP